MTVRIFIEKVLRRFKMYFLKVVNHTIGISRRDKQKLEAIRSQFPRVLDTSQTLDLILKRRLSVCRFGDAEFDIMEKLRQGDVYQSPSAELSRRLKEVLLYQSDDKILVCIPPFNSPTNNLFNYYRRLSFWEMYWLKRYDALSQYFIYPQYANSFISRETVFYENDVEKVKKIWAGRNVVFVYGGGGRFKTDSFLFSNIQSYDVIVVPPQSAFNQYEQILQKCLCFPMASLFIIAAGPAATVLAFDLAHRGYQALDMGHIPNCYEQYMGLAPCPEVLPLVTGSKNE